MRSALVARFRFARSWCSKPPMKPSLCWLCERCLCVPEHSTTPLCPRHALARLPRGPCYPCAHCRRANMLKWLVAVASIHAIWPAARGPRLTSCIHVDRQHQRRHFGCCAQALCVHRIRTNAAHFSSSYFRWRRDFRRHGKRERELDRVAAATRSQRIVHTVGAIAIRFQRNRIH